MRLRGGSNTLGMAALLLIGALALPCAVSADDLASAGRSIAAKSGDAVVYIELVIKMKSSYGGQSDSQEAKSDGTGVVIDPSGLIVIPYAAANPAEIAADMYGSEGGSSYTSEVTSLKIRLSDGTEMPGKVVLRDKDLDLVFVRPARKPVKPLAAISLTDSGRADILGQVLVLHRLGKVANTSLAATLQRVNAIIDKPRLSYTVGTTDAEAQYGAPVFTMDGKILGLLLRRANSAGSGGNGDGSLTLVVIPAADIAAAAVQAPADVPKPPAKSTKPVKAPQKPPKRKK
jgi:S1-C subfamily serine protease